MTVNNRKANIHTCLYNLCAYEPARFLRLPVRRDKSSSFRGVPFRRRGPPGDGPRTSCLRGERCPLLFVSQAPIKFLGLFTEVDHDEHPRFIDDALDQGLPAPGFLPKRQIERAAPQDAEGLPRLGCNLAASPPRRIRSASCDVAAKSRLRRRSKEEGAAKVRLQVTQHAQNRLEKIERERLHFVEEHDRAGDVVKFPTTRRLAPKAIRETELPSSR